MHQQATRTINLEPVTSTTTTTTTIRIANDSTQTTNAGAFDNFDYYDNYNGNNNYLNQCCPSQSAHYHNNNYNNTFTTEPAQAEQYTASRLYDYMTQFQQQEQNNDEQQLQQQQQQQQQQHQQQTSDSQLDSIAFALEGISAIINGKESNDLTLAPTAHNRQQQQRPKSVDDTNNEAASSFVSSYKQEVIDDSYQQQHETEASIYENLKSIIESDTETNMATASKTTGPQGPFKRISGDQANQQQHLNTQPASSSATKTTTTTTTTTTTAKPYVEIIEQPSKCALRFRYKCEGRSAGSLPGVSSTGDNKTFPTIRINNYHGRAVVVISCVTKDAPYRAHPHNIVGKEGCKKGICTIVLNSGSGGGGDGGGGGGATNEDQQQSQNGGGGCIIRTFSSLGIQCVKRKDIEDSLSLRESIHVDPFRNGFQHKLDTSAIDLNVVRLCFQVFIEGTTPNKCDIPLAPVVSDPIHDKKAMSDLVITKLSHCSAPATGGRDMILLCDRIAKDDIQVRFYEESRDGELIWETFSEISPADVHKQVAICFKTPKYYNENITQPAMARIQLQRVSDQQVSEPRLFQFLPCESDEDIISRKRQKIEWVNMNNIFQLQAAAPSQAQQQ